MRRNAKGRKCNRQKTKLGLPDLEQAKAAVLVSLRSPESQRSYRHSIDEFVFWYCSEPRLSFNKTVVTRYRMHLEDRQLAPGTVNVRLAAVRRLAYEAADTGLLSPELAAGIRRVKGSKKLGIRLGNWLTANEARMLWQLPDVETLKGKRDRAMLSILLGCGLRRGELTRTHLRPSPAPRGSLGDSGSHRKGRPHSDGSGSRLGQAGNRRLADGGRRIARQTVPTGLLDGSSLRYENDGKGGLACCEEICRCAGAL